MSCLGNGWLGRVVIAVNGMPKQRREGEANGPRGQRPAGASRIGPPVRRSFSEGGSWTEFVRPAHQAVVAFAGAGIINRAEPRACGHSRGPIHLDTEPDTERDTGSASNAAGDGCGRARSDKAGLQPYRENSPYGMNRGGGGNVGRTYPDSESGFATMLERAETREAIGLNRSRLHSTRPVTRICVMPTDRFGFLPRRRF